MLERLQVGQGLAAVAAPGVFAADRAGEPQLEQRIEIAVGGLQHLAEHAVQLLRGDRVQRDAPDEVDVADPVQRVVHPVEPGVALQEEAVDRLVGLVGLPADERLHEQRLLAHDQPAVGLQAVGAGQGHEELAGLPRGVVDVQLAQRRRHGRVDARQRVFVHHAGAATRSRWRRSMNSAAASA